MKKSSASRGETAQALISKRIAELGDWRGKTLARMRKLIREADPDVLEEWKWMGTPVWSHDGILCTGESYKKVVKLTFAKGASLEDPARLFNASLDGKVRRAIDIHEGEEIDASAFQALVRAALARNRGGKAKPAKKALRRRAASKPAPSVHTRPADPPPSATSASIIRASGTDSQRAEPSSGSTRRERGTSASP